MKYLLIVALFIVSISHAAHEVKIAECNIDYTISRNGKIQPLILNLIRLQDDRTRYRWQSESQDYHFSVELNTRNGDDVHIYFLGDILEMVAYDHGPRLTGKGSVHFPNNIVFHFKDDGNGKFTVTFPELYWDVATNIFTTKMYKRRARCHFYQKN